MKCFLLVGATSPYSSGLRCRCPRCGKGRLFKGFLTLQPCCDICGLDFAVADSGDGPAVFVILLAGALVVGLALGVEIEYQPPSWLHAVVLGPADSDCNPWGAAPGQELADSPAISSWSLRRSPRNHRQIACFRRYFRLYAIASLPEAKS